MIDHIVANVSNLEVSKSFYVKALAPLNYILLKEFEDTVSFGVISGAEKSKDPGGDFWITRDVPQSPRFHFAFSASSQSEVDMFYKRALAAGGINNGSPGFRKQYHEHYYAAFILDPDGYDIEAVCHFPR